MSGKFFLKILAPAAFILLASLLFAWPSSARADCTQDTNLDVVARDPSGAYIPNATVEIYKQEYDANNHPKPTTRFDSATADPNLGVAHLSWRNSLMTDTYALKIRTVNNDAAAFWYYNLTLNCGDSFTSNYTLSGIDFWLHDADGNILANTSFSVYSQNYDTSGQPLKEKKALITNLTSASNGEVKIYLPQGSARGLDNSLSDHYLLELNRNSVKFTQYDIPVADGQITTDNFFLSALKIILQDATGALFPANTNVEIYQQTIDANGDPQSGAKVGQFSLNSSGYGTLGVPAGVYVAGLKGQTGQYQYFYNLEALNGQTTEYTLTASQSWTPATGSCSNNSQLTIALRNYSGDLTPGLKYALYEQGTDANGLPLAGSQVGNGTIGDSGQAVMTFRPDPRKIYALKVWDKRSDLGDFWFYSAVRFVCDYNRSLTEYLPSLKIILRDGQGNLKKNYNFSLYSQEYDADLNPTFSGSDLIANLQTDARGQSVVYVAPYNPYRRGQSGVYALTLKDASGNLLTAYNIRVLPDKDYAFQYYLSSLGGELRNARGQLLGNKELRLYQQSAGPVLGTRLLTTKTDASGRFQMEYPAGTYALATLDDFNQENIFWNIVAKTSAPSKRLTVNLTNFSLADTSGGQSAPNNAALKLYTLSADGSGGYYRDKTIGDIKLSASKTASMSLASGPYLALYIGASNQEYGQAFYASNGLIQNVKVVISTKTRLTDNQRFTLAATTNYGVTTISGASGATATTVSVASRLKGRILLQVQDKGQAWYVSPVNGKRYSLGRPDDAFRVMRGLGLGISNADFNKLAVTANKSLAGRILIKVGDSGRAYYYNPVDLKLYYLGRPADAFSVMRALGLGISNGDLSKISLGN